MKMMSKRSVKRIDEHLEMAKFHLLGCIKAMKGKYGTQDVVRNMKWAIRDIDQALSDDPKFDLLNGFRNPPNTPKSRRLGWHEGRVSNCKHESNGQCSLHDKPCCKKERRKKYCYWYKPEGVKAKGDS